MGESAHLSPIVASPPWSSPGRFGREVPSFKISCRWSMPCNRLMRRELAMTLAKKSDWPELLPILSATVTVGRKPPRGDPREMPFIEWSFLFGSPRLSARGVRSAHDRSRKTEESDEPGQRKPLNIASDKLYYVNYEESRPAAETGLGRERRTGRSSGEALCCYCPAFILRGALSFFG